MVGQQPGRPALTVPSKRGWSSAALYWSGQAAKEEQDKQREAKRRATGYQPSAPSSVQPGSFAANLSDAAAARCSLTAVQDRLRHLRHSESFRCFCCPLCCSRRRPRGLSRLRCGRLCPRAVTAGSRARSWAPALGGPKGPNVHFTNFSIVRAVLHGRRLPLNSNIYFNKQSNDSCLP